MILSLLISICFAQDLPGEELFVKETPKDVARQDVKVLSKTKERSPAPSNPRSASSTLPIEYLKPLFRQSTESMLIQPNKGAKEIFRAIKQGEIIPLIVNHSVIAFPDEKAPVVAIPNQSQYRGIKLLGESYLEPNSKRIFINFKKLILGDKSYTFQGTGLTDDGTPGLHGEYHSREAEYFAGDFISSFVAGYFDGLVPRTRNAYGQIEQDATVDAAVKKGLSSGALSSADRFKEKLKKIPEFSEIKGPFEMKALILDQPVSIK